MSPDSFDVSYANEYYVSISGVSSSFGVKDFNDARPVVNLKSEVLLQGTGTASDPYHLASWSKIKNTCAMVSRPNESSFGRGKNLYMI